jgi:hypothetical protein
LLHIVGEPLEALRPQIAGGRHGGKARVSRRELLEFYKEVYTRHTPFRELFTIAQRILR